MSGTPAARARRRFPRCDVVLAGSDDKRRTTEVGRKKIARVDRHRSAGRAVRDLAQFIGRVGRKDINGRARG